MENININELKKRNNMKLTKEEEYIIDVCVDNGGCNTELPNVDDGTEVLLYLYWKKKYEEDVEKLKKKNEEWRFINRLNMRQVSYLNKLIEKLQNEN